MCFNFYLSSCALIDIADVVSSRWLRLYDVHKDVSIASLVISREGNHVNRVLMHDILERWREEREREGGRGRGPERKREWGEGGRGKKFLHTLVPLSRHMSERIEMERSTSGISHPGLLVLRTSAAT